MKNNAYLLKKIFQKSKELVIVPGLLSLAKGAITTLGGVWILYDTVEILETGGEVRQIFSVILLYYFLITVYCTVNVWFTNYRQPVLSLRVTEKMVYELLDKAKEIGLKSYEDTQCYDVFRLAKNCAETTSLRLLSNCQTALQCLMSLICGIVSAVAIDWHLLFFVILVIPSSLLSRSYGREKGLVSREMVRPKRVGDAVVSAFLSKGQARIIRTSKAGELLRSYYNDSVKKQMEVIRAHRKKLGILYFFNYYLAVDFIAMIAYLYAIIRIIVIGNASLAEMSVLIAAVMSIVSRIRKLIGCYEQASRHSVSVENLMAFYALKGEIPNGELICDSFEEIEFRHVFFSYRDRPVLKDINIKIHKGEKTAIVGYNGAGKTTFIKLLLGLYRPTQGEILLNGERLEKYSIDSRKKLFGVMFQDFYLFSAPILENVSLCAEEGSVRREVLQALRTAGLSFDEEMIGLDYGRTFQKNGIVLSGGQEQKLVFARLVYSGRSVWIMDEPSAALDPLAEEELYHNILKESDDKTVLFISHRLSCAKLVDRILLFDKGEIAETGNHDQLMEADGEYAKLFRQQASVYNAERANI